MKTFKAYLEEELLNELAVKGGLRNAINALKGMDIKFLKQVMKFPEPKIPFKYFESMDKKTEIQYLYRLGMFPEIEHETLKNASLSEKDKDTLNELIEKLKKSPRFDSVYKYQKTGIGPGEVLMYYMLDNAKLGGQGSTGDLIIGSNTYEIKAPLISAEKRANQFQIGGTINSDVEVPEALKLVDLYNNFYKSKVKEIKVTQLTKFKKDDPKTYETWRKGFSQKVYKGYFSKHLMIFFDVKKGYIASIKKVQPKDIDVYRIMQRGIDYSVDIS